MATSRYDKIWNAIKKAGIGKPVTVRCRPDKVPTIVLKVKQIKSGENRARIDLDLGRYGKLRIRRKVEAAVNWAWITFELMSTELSENI